MKLNKTRLLLILLSAAVIILLLLDASAQDPWRRKAELETPMRMQALQARPNNLSDWPPHEGRAFPNIPLFDQNGSPFSVQSLSGKPSIIEIVAMSCAGCQAYSGGNKFGGYSGFPAQADLKSIEEYLRSYGKGVELFGEELNFVQIIIYNLQLATPTASDLSSWAAHFHLDIHSNTHVVSGGDVLNNRDSFKLIPGFYLLDKDLVVKSDSTGHTPLRNLYLELLPSVSNLIQGR